MTNKYYQKHKERYQNLSEEEKEKLIFRILLIKLATECTFKFNSRFFGQMGGCTMRGPLSVTFSDIYFVKWKIML